MINDHPERHLAEPLPLTDEELADIRNRPHPYGGANCPICRLLNHIDAQAR